MLPALDVAQASLPHDALGNMSPFKVARGYPMPLECDWIWQTDIKRLPAKERLNREDAQRMVKTL